MAPTDELPYLPARAQRWLKVVHLVSAGVWLGSLSSMVLLHALAQTLTSERRFGVDRALYEIHEVVLMKATEDALSKASECCSVIPPSP